MNLNSKKQTRLLTFSLLRYEMLEQSFMHMAQGSITGLTNVALLSRTIIATSFSSLEHPAVNTK